MPPRPAGRSKRPEKSTEPTSLDKTICLAMIVKNEAKNMVRLLDSLKGVVNFISIVDTGSSDNTKQVIQDWGKRHKIPTTVHQEPWKNFGYNRTHSVQMARRTYPQAHYLLLSDADFVWEIEGKFDKRLLFEDSYLVDQYNDIMRYANTRLLSNKLRWECVGVTHEFWRAVDPSKRFFSKNKITTLVIKDIGDGGAKEDKFERDERLLREGLNDPTTPDDLKIRYRFYLGQTLHDLGKYEEAIEWYTKRAQDAGFVEETYYTMYKVGLSHEKIAWNKRHLVTQTINGSIEPLLRQRWNPNNVDSKELGNEASRHFDLATKWYKAATEYRPERAEALYALAKMLRLMGFNDEAYKVAKVGQKITYPKDDVLFVEHAIYRYLFDYELSIVAYYVPGCKDEGREACVRLLRNKDLPNDLEAQTRRNSKFYL